RAALGRGDLAPRGGEARRQGDAGFIGSAVRPRLAGPPPSIASRSRHRGETSAPRSSGTFRGSRPIGTDTRRTWVPPFAGLLQAVTAEGELRPGEHGGTLRQRAAGPPEPPPRLIRE